MFESYYGLAKTPFSKEIPPSAVFAHDSLAEALARLAWAVERRAIAVLCGEVGSGKSLALRKMVAELEAARHTCLYLSNPTGGVRGMLQDIVAGLNRSPSFFAAELVRQAREAVESEVGRGKNLVVLADEAHLLSVGALEEMRLLTNFEMDSAPKFSLILAGQPSLQKKLRFSTLAALEQRVALRIHLLPLNPEETAGYLRHHLGLAGRSDHLFSDDAVSLIHKASGGIPRQINNLAIQALMAGYAEKKSIVDEATARRAVAELESD